MSSYDIYSWIGGIACELLKPKKSWKKGTVKIKILLEFCPDEPDEKDLIEEIEKPESESPLDDIRKAINEIS